MTRTRSSPIPPTNTLSTDLRSAGSAAFVEHIRVGPARGTGAVSGTDVASLLHRRLWFFSVLFSAATAAMVAWQGKRLFEYDHVPRDWIDFAALAIVLAVLATAAAMLWRQRPPSLRQLRTLELILFGAGFALWSWVHATVYPTLRWAHPPHWFGYIMATAVGVPWAFMIIVYGIFIPNTWRRCAALVAILLVTPFAISVATGLSTDATEGHFQGNYFIALGMLLGLAAAIGIYGAHRLEVLRREVVAARQLGQYRLTRRLGAGGMGEVYLAEHVLLRRPCAVKLIRPDRATDVMSLVRFEREVQATANLTHPNTVQVFDYGHAEDGTFYYAMEYLPGMNLEEFVKRFGPLPAERAIHLLRQACGALYEAHAAGLIHRDIKPSNIIICERGGMHDVAKLLDFGLVRSHETIGAEPLTQEDVIAGTPAYMSPEQADGKQDLDAASDIYSVGAVAYFLLTGQPPFVRATHLQTLIAHACDMPVPPDQLQPQVPCDLQAAVLQCLEKDPARRFPDTQSLDRTLSKCQAAGQWTEDRAAAWWAAQPGSANGDASAAQAATTVTGPAR